MERFKYNYTLERNGKAFTDDMRNAVEIVVKRSMMDYTLIPDENGVYILSTDIPQSTFEKMLARAECESASRRDGVCYFTKAEWNDAFFRACLEMTANIVCDAPKAVLQEGDQTWE